jgi:hypothetical protein
LPTEEEVLEMIKQGAEAAKVREPDPAGKKDLSSAELNKAKTEQIRAEMTGSDAESQLDYMAIASGDPKVYQ